MYQHPKYPVTPVLEPAIVDDNAETCLFRHNKVAALANAEKPVWCKLDWKPVDRLEYNPFPPGFRDYVNPFRFLLFPHEMREIAYQVERGKEEWSRPFPHEIYRGQDTAEREALLTPAREHFKCAFWILARNCFVPCQIETHERIYTREDLWSDTKDKKDIYYFSKEIFFALMLTRLWSGQTGALLLPTIALCADNISFLKKNSKIAKTFFDSLDNNLSRLNNGPIALTFPWNEIRESLNVIIDHATDLKNPSYIVYEVSKLIDGYEKNAKAYSKDTGKPVEFDRKKIFNMVAEILKEKGITHDLNIEYISTFLSAHKKTIEALCLQAERLKRNKVKSESVSQQVGTHLDILIEACLEEGMDMKYARVYKDTVLRMIDVEPSKVEGGS